MNKKNLAVATNKKNLMIAGGAAIGAWAMVTYMGSKETAAGMTSSASTFDRPAAAGAAVGAILAAMVAAMVAK